MNTFLTSLWQEIRWVVRVSRPRFWLYLFGPFLIGIVTAVRLDPNWIRLGVITRVETLNHGIAQLAVMIPLIIRNLLNESPGALLILIGTTFLTLGYFLFPANVLVYGINDLFDAETDALNPKKDAYESRLSPTRQRRLVLYIVLAQLPWLFIAIIGLIFSSDYLLKPILAFVAFLFLSVFYSATPIRAKTRPFLDSAFNILYLLPGLVSYLFVSMFTPTVGMTRLFPWLPVIAAACWCMAMHAYSAVPDIQADMQAKLRTIATQLGAYKTTLLCSMLYITAAVLACLSVSSVFLRLIFLLLGLVYVILMHISLTRMDDLLPVYKRFPLVNTLVGTILFFALLLF